MEVGNSNLKCYTAITNTYLGFWIRLVHQSQQLWDSTAAGPCGCGQIPLHPRPPLSSWVTIPCPVLHTNWVFYSMTLASVSTTESYFNQIWHLRNLIPFAPLVPGSPFGPVAPGTPGHPRRMASFSSPFRPTILTSAEK